MTTCSAPAELEFRYYQFASTFNSPSIKISMNGGSSWTEIVAEHNETGDLCVEKCIDLGSYTGQSDVRFRFITNTSSTSYQAYFDNIELHLNRHQRLM
ncbi:hypothetical protein K8T06_04910 [bacterium]|nr:hypothetical protein [bacterium]